MLKHPEPPLGHATGCGRTSDMKRGEKSKSPIRQDRLGGTSTVNVPLSLAGLNQLLFTHAQLQSYIHSSNNYNNIILEFSSEYKNVNHDYITVTSII